MTRAPPPMPCTSAALGCKVSTIAVSGTTSVWPRDRHHHAVEHGQGQRQAHGEGRALARPRRDRNAAAQRLDRALDHVHADAAAGNVRDRRGGREARQEDQIVDLFVGQLRVGGDQAFARRRSPCTRGRLMPAPSSETSMTMRPERCGADSRTRPSAGLPAAMRVLRRFEAVVDGVADHVGQRIGEALDHRLVDLGAFAFGDEAHRLAGHGGDFAHEPRHALEHRISPAARGSPSRCPGFRGSAARVRRGPWPRRRRAQGPPPRRAATASPD